MEDLDAEEAFQCGTDDWSTEASRSGSVPLAEVIRKAGISEQTFYRPWTVLNRNRLLTVKVSAFSGYGYDNEKPVLDIPLYA
jgi:hypothetical protein